MRDPTEYPKRMVHPSYKKAEIKRVTGKFEGSEREWEEFHTVSTERLSPVDVCNPDEEAQYRAKGYKPYGEQTVDAIAYLEYPKMMVHPDHVPAQQAIAAVLNGANQVVTPAVPAIAAKLPDLTVHNEDQEFAAVAKGYQLPGTPNPDAVQASISSPYDPSRVKSEYPKVVNGVTVSDPDIQVGPKEYPKWVNLPDHPQGGVEVKNRAEEYKVTGKAPPVMLLSKQAQAAKRKAELEAELAALNVAEDKEPDAPVVAPAEDTERTELIAEADRRGVKIDKRWSIVRIRRALARAETNAAPDMQAMA